MSQPVHPRWRGEHLRRCPGISQPDGSSPLARGTQLHVGVDVDSDRFIPAGAGNTAGLALVEQPASVHPRWRGEHGLTMSARKKHNGSSPLARGTQRGGMLAGAEGRFIPAGAGNT